MYFYVPVFLYKILNQFETWKISPYLSRDFLVENIGTDEFYSLEIPGTRSNFEFLFSGKKRAIPTNKHLVLSMERKQLRMPLDTKWNILMIANNN